MILANISLLSCFVMNLFALLVVYLCFALSLSLAGILTNYVTDIVSIILISAMVLRLVELLLSSLVWSRLSLMFCMPVSIVALFLCSLLLETISIGFRSVSLGFRVFANVSAGHVLSDILNSLRYFPVSGLTSLISQAVYSYAIFVYEFLVSCVQIGVFISLISVYIE